METPRVRLGELLVRAGLISEEQLEESLAEQRRIGKRLGTLLVESGLVSETQVTQILSQQLSVPWVSLHHIDFSRQLLDLVPLDLVERFCLIPIYVRRVRGLGEALYVAMDDPTNAHALSEVAERSGLHVRAMIAPPSDIRAAIRAYYGIGDEPAPPPPAPAVRDEEEEDVPTGIHRVTVKSSPDLPPPSAPRAAPPPSQPELDDAVDDLIGRGEELKSSPRATSPSRSELGSSPRATSPSQTEIGSSPRKAAPSQPGIPVEEGSRARLAGSSGAPRRMIALTLLDGTTINLPAKGKGSKGRGPAAEVTEATVAEPAPGAPAEADGDQLTARDIVAALRAASHGADASEILGTNARWEAMFSALLSLLLKKRVIADWEFVEEFKKL